MTSLVRERLLIFSPALAATIGLEEAILLHLLNDLAAARPARDWHEVEAEVLEQLLPFWDRRELQRVSRSLADKGVLLLDGSAGTNLRFRFNEDEPSHPAASAPSYTSSYPLPATTAKTASLVAETAPPRPRGATLLNDLWQPDEDLLQLLALNHTIPRQFALAQLEDFKLYWRERAEVSHAWSSRFRQHVLRQWRLEQQRTREQAATRAEAPTGDWYPSADAIQILERSGVSREFMEDAVAEFVLYWRERGDSDGTWNSKFIAHIRRQWARFSNAVAHEREPRPIAPNWQPSEDVYDILRMANIDLAFARELLPEFILFWRDTGTVQRSWNTKFLQHVKYQWATRHHLAGAANGRPQLAAGAVAQSPRSSFEQLTDRSWAAGLVDGL